MDFQPVAADELKAIVHSFNSYKDSGVDNIPIRIIKLSIDIIVEPLTEINNLSLESGFFPHTLKVQKFSLILKLVIQKNWKLSAHFHFSSFF